MSNRDAFEAWYAPIFKAGEPANMARTKHGYRSVQDDIAWMAWQAAQAQERERLCAAIKAEDDHCATGDYMLDSNDCIKVIRGEWLRPDYDVK